jgi:hypothetical protein
MMAGDKIDLPQNGNQIRAYERGRNPVTIGYRTPSTVLVADKSLIKLTLPEPAFPGLCRIAVVDLATRQGRERANPINPMAPERQIHVVHPKRARLVLGLRQYF